MRVIDSHTEGEPTRVVVDGGPPLGSGSLAERRQIFARDFDRVRSFAVNEPRGSDAMVGALLTEPTDPSCAAGVIFFNNVGMLGMCGHGTIGLAVTLYRLGRIGLGQHRIETPVGVVGIDVTTPNEVTVSNVPSYRHRAGVTVDVPSLGPVTGDVAWGGNWFFLVDAKDEAMRLADVSRLTARAEAIKTALETYGVTGRDGAPVDHIEIFGRPVARDAQSRNFVLCPGGAYDRSPCGTGTSAKLACLAADGKLAPDTNWVQESIVGSRFVARYRPGPDGTVAPEITGRAYVVAESVLIRNPADPFADGIRQD